MDSKVEVEKVSNGTFRTVFTVGVQRFELAYSDEPEEAEQHCAFIKRMFLKALAQAFGKKAKWAVVRAPTGEAVAMFRDEGAAADWVECHYNLGKSEVESITVPGKPGAEDEP